jgi:glutathionylspermidine synthase
MIATTHRARPAGPAELAHPLRAGVPIDATPFAILRRRALLEGCKWDPQVGDVETLTPFPLVMTAGEWNRLAWLAERLTSEAMAAEEETLARPDLIALLGFPPTLRRVLSERIPLTPAAGRVMRFDFHFTTEGWRISEVNSDVPGGFTEASCFTGMVANHFPHLRIAGDPAGDWSRVLAETAGDSGVVALLSAPGYMEDHQVIAFLAAQLRERGCQAFLAKPEQIVWRNGAAQLETEWHRGPADVIVRFYQAEWVSRLPQKLGWQHLFRAGKTRVTAPAAAVISESKRFPLTWDHLSVGLPTWRTLLPETRDPRQAPWAQQDGWLLKTAMCNTGDTVRIRELMPARDWRWTRLELRLNPSRWVAQRRFQSVPVSTPIGWRHACVGVYTVNGRAAGAYARLSEKPVIDFAASDVALLLEDEY